MCAEGDFRVQQCWCRDGFDQPASVVVRPAGSQLHHTASGPGAAAAARAANSSTRVQDLTGGLDRIGC